MAKAKAEKSKVHSVRWTAEEWRRINTVAREMTATVGIALEPVDIIRGAVNQYVTERLGAAGSAK